MKVVIPTALKTTTAAFSVQLTLLWTPARKHKLGKVWSNVWLLRSFHLAEGKKDHLCSHEVLVLPFSFSEHYLPFKYCYKKKTFLYEILICLLVLALSNFNFKVWFSYVLFQRISWKPLRDRREFLFLWNWAICIHHNRQWNWGENVNAKLYKPVLLLTVLVAEALRNVAVRGWAFNKTIAPWNY